MVVKERLGACGTMKIGDLVRFRSSYPDWPVGIVVEIYQISAFARNPAYNEVRVQWLDDAGKDVSWVRPKDLETVSEGR